MSAQKKTSDNFDNLVAGITKKERRDILKNVRPGVANGIGTIQDDGKSEKLNTKKALINNFNHENLITKFIIWIKSFVMNRSVEELYNTAVVSTIAKQLDRDYPGLMSGKNKTFGSKFYYKLQDLSKAQSFFAEQAVNASSESGAFYFMLAYIVMPELMEDIKTACDPYQYPFSKQLTHDTKNFLLTRMEELLASISSDKKNRMTNSALSFEWICSFVRLPIAALLSRFSDSAEGGKTLLFSQIKNDFSVIARILDSQPSLQDEMLRILFQPIPKSSSLWNYTSSGDDSQSVTDKINSVSTEIAVINMFINTIPIKKIGKVLYENSLFNPEPFALSENWFLKFRDKWAEVFECRWKMWDRDFKKETSKKKLKIYFGLFDLQRFPYHPWDRVASIVPFTCDLTLGFLNYHFKKEYIKYANILNIVTLEGDFSIKENRQEFTDAVSDLNGIIVDLEKLSDLLSLSGEYGEEFMKFDEDRITQNIRERYTVIINEIKDISEGCYDVFMKNCEKMQNLLLAMLGEKTSVYYGPLTNLSKIMGSENRNFREAIERFACSLKYAQEVLKEHHDIDMIKI